jgi:hypothetical protein
MVDKYKKLIAQQFPFKDLGPAKYILGLEIERNRDDRTILLHQHGYIANLLARTNMAECRPAATPSDVSITLSSSMSPTTAKEKEYMENIPYRQTTSSLLWLACNTRPDITEAVNTVCRFNQNPGISHWTAVKRILRYLKGTSKLGVTLGGTEETLQLVGYADADWARDIDSRRSTTGYVFMLGSYPVTWKSKLQVTPALSTMEAELMAITAANQEAQWIRKLLNDIGYAQLEATVLNEDNQSCIKYIYGTKWSPRSKHIGVRYYYVKDSVKNGEVKIQYCPTQNMVADMLTKPLNTETFCKHRTALGLRSATVLPSGSVDMT